MKLPKKNIFILLFIFIIILIFIFVFIKSKDKFSIKDIPIICTTILPPENKFNQNKLGFVYSTKFRWLPVQNPIGDPSLKMFGFKPIYIKFIGIGKDSLGWEVPLNFYNQIKYFDNPINAKRIPYTILSDGKVCILDPLETRTFKNAKEAIKVIVNARWQPLINIPLIFLENDDPKDAQIRIEFDTSTKRTNSMVGMDCLTRRDQNQSTMNFSWYDVGSVLHEFGHALGLLHEHQSPFNNPLDWNEKELYKYYGATTKEKIKYINDNIINRDPKDVAGTDFDKDSIMLYYFPASVTRNGKGTSANQRLSIIDMIQIHKLYPAYDNITYQEIIDLKYVSTFYDEIYGDIKNAIIPDYISTS